LPMFTTGEIAETLTICSSSVFAWLLFWCFIGQ
jgi:hypothetical protein